jgi:hypothetical protein
VFQLEYVLLFRKEIMVFLPLFFGKPSQFQAVNIKAITNEAPLGNQFCIIWAQEPFL